LQKNKEYFIQTNKLLNYYLKSKFSCQLMLNNKNKYIIKKLTKNWNKFVIAIIKI